MQDVNNNQALQVVSERMVDTLPEEESVSTGDIIPYSALENLILPLRDGGGMAIQDQMLVHTVPDLLQREMLADYYSREAVSIKKFAGKVIKIYGMILWEQPGGWKGKDQLWHHEGYFQVRMLVEDETLKDNPIVLVKSSGAGLGRHVYHILANRGWFLFDEPISYRVEIGEDNAHRIYNVSHDIRRALKGKKT